MDEIEATQGYTDFGSQYLCEQFGIRSARQWPLAALALSGPHPCFFFLPQFQSLQTSHPSLDPAVAGY